MAEVYSEITLRELLGNFVGGVVFDLASATQFVNLFSDRDSIRKNLVSQLKSHAESYGLTVDDVAIESLEQTPLEFYDFRDELDRQALEHLERAAAEQDEIRKRLKAEVADLQKRLDSP